MYHEFLVIASAHFLALLSPGQDFVLLLRTSLRHGAISGTRASAGIALANAVWICFAVFAVGFLGTYPLVMSIFRYFGALVLVYMGCCFLKAGPGEAGSATVVMEAEKRDYGERFFLSGFLSGISNPKNGLFYASLFSVGVSVDTPTEWKVLYGVWMTMVVLLWDIGISMFIGADKTRLLLARWQWRIERIAGALLILLGILMVFS